ncbi:MAG: PTS fructose-like transporter subunit IIB, partial [Microcoleus sp. SIO2G3]|nr:PTS fructose-like transporter subunit IIB [Microcoleus sp. SIO2G3]
MTNKIAAITACPTGIAHTYMAAEALRKTAEVMGYDIKVETQGSNGVQNPLSDADIAAADFVIVAADIHVDPTRFAGKPIYATSTSQAIRNTRMVIEEAIEESRSLTPVQTIAQPHAAQSQASVDRPGNGTAVAVPAATDSKHLVGITACPTGIAHTFMAAEALRKAAIELGHDIKVETQGSVGAKNSLTPEEIAQADAVVIAADTHVDLSRFAGKRVYETSTKQALKAGKDVIASALTLPEPTTAAAGQGDYLQAVKQAKADQAARRSGPYKHLLT